MTRIATAAMLAALISSARPFSMVKPPVNRGSSRFFLETADVNEWADLLPLGIFHGVITSPVLLQRVGLRCSVETCRELADQALELGAGEVLLQAWGESTDSLVACALGLHAGEARVVIKVPATATGTRAAAALVRRGVRVCLTGAFGTHQALVAVGVGAEYIAPHLGRLTDSGEDGRAEMAGMLSVIDGVGGKTRVLAAGLRDVDDIEVMASVGVGCVAIRPASARMLVALEPRSEAYAASAEKAASGLVPPGWQRFDPKQAGARGGATTRRALRRGEEEVIELFLEGYDDDDDDGDDDDDDDDDGSESRSAPPSSPRAPGRSRLCDPVAHSLDTVTAVGELELGVPDDDEDSSEEAGNRARVVIAFDYVQQTPSSVERTPLVVLQFQSRDTFVGDGHGRWQPEDSWVGEHGRSKGMWQILDSLRWG